MHNTPTDEPDMATVVADSSKTPLDQLADAEQLSRLRPPELLERLCPAGQSKVAVAAFNSSL